MNPPYSNAPVPVGNSGGGSPFDQIMLLDHNGEERWTARDLQPMLGYGQWRQLDDVVQRARAAIDASNMDSRDHIAGARKVIPGGRWGKQEVDDYRLTRFGAYHVALAADGRKPEVAMAKTYFAVKTREAELAQPRVPDISTSRGVLEMASMLHDTALKLVRTELELEQAKPKAGKWEAFCNSDNLVEMGAAAKAFSKVTGGLGRTKFMELLRTDDMHFLQVQNPRIPYESHIKAGRAEVKMVQAANGQWMEQTFFTSKGLDWLADRLGWSAASAA